MDLPQLTDDQLQQVQEFFVSPAAILLFQRLEAEILAAWMVGSTPEFREKCWHELNAVLELQTKLRDAAANKKLSQRSQNVRATNADYGTRSHP